MLTAPFHAWQRGATWQTNAAGHPEFVYAARHSGIGDLKPDMLEGMLPEGASVRRRSYLTNSDGFDVLVALRGPPGLRLATRLTFSHPPRNAAGRLSGQT